MKRHNGNSRAPRGEPDRWVPGRPVLIMTDPGTRAPGVALRVSDERPRVVLAAYAPGWWCKVPLSPEDALRLADALRAAGTRVASQKGGKGGDA